MKQIITIRLEREEWMQAIADYLKVKVEEIETFDHSCMELTLKKPLSKNKKDDSFSIFTKDF